MILDINYYYESFRVMPFNIFGVKLFGVESDTGRIESYCDTRVEAQEYCDKLNKMECDR